MRVDLPSAVRNPISLTGVAVTTAMAVVFLIPLALEMSGRITKRPIDRRRSGDERRLGDVPEQHRPRVLYRMFPLP